MLDCRVLLIHFVYYNKQLRWPRVRDVVASNSNSLCDRFADFLIASALPNFDPFDIHADGANAGKGGSHVLKICSLLLPSLIRKDSELFFFTTPEKRCARFLKL